MLPFKEKQLNERRRFAVESHNRVVHAICNTDDDKCAFGNTFALLANNPIIPASILFITLSEVHTKYTTRKMASEFAVDIDRYLLGLYTNRLVYTKLQQSIRNDIERKITHCDEEIMLQNKFMSEFQLNGIELLDSKLIEFIRLKEKEGNLIRTYGSNIEKSTLAYSDAPKEFHGVPYDILSRLMKRKQIHVDYKKMSTFIRFASNEAIRKHLYNIRHNEFLSNAPVIRELVECRRRMMQLNSYNIQTYKLRYLGITKSEANKFLDDEAKECMTKKECEFDEPHNIDYFIQLKRSDLTGLDENARFSFNIQDCINVMVACFSRHFGISITIQDIPTTCNYKSKKHLVYFSVVTNREIGNIILDKYEAYRGIYIPNPGSITDKSLVIAGCDFGECLDIFDLITLFTTFGTALQFVLNGSTNIYGLSSCLIANEILLRFTSSIAIKMLLDNGEDIIRKMCCLKSNEMGSMFIKRYIAFASACYYVSRLLQIAYAKYDLTSYSSTEIPEKILANMLTKYKFPTHEHEHSLYWTYDITRPDYSVSFIALYAAKYITELVKLPTDQHMKIIEDLSKLPFLQLVKKYLG